jgi:hypothetical protein
MIGRRVRVALVLLLTSAGIAGPRPAPAEAQPRDHLLVITGIGGEVYYGDLFHRWATTLVEVAIDRLAIPSERIVYLGERVERNPEMISARSDRSNVLAAVRALTTRSRPGDRVLIVLIGHGTARGQRALFNLPGPDLSAEALAAELAPLSDRVVAVVNTAPASGAFVGPLSAPGRVVITATSGQAENQHTVFAAHFVDAFAEDGADADKDDRVSLLEAFQYARREVDRAYRLEKRLLTEHALLDDDGDGVGTRRPGPDTLDGALARRFQIAPADSDDPETSQGRFRLALQVEARRLVDRIELLKRRKLGLQEADYQQRLETLLVELALNRRAYRDGGRHE